MIAMRIYSLRLLGFFHQNPFAIGERMWLVSAMNFRNILEFRIQFEHFIFDAATVANYYRGATGNKQIYFLHEFTNSFILDFWNRFFCHCFVFNSPRTFLGTVILHAHVWSSHSESILVSWGQLQKKLGGPHTLTHSYTWTGTRREHKVSFTWPVILFRTLFDAIHTIFFVFFYEQKLFWTPTTTAATKKDQTCLFQFNRIKLIVQI